MLVRLVLKKSTISFTGPFKSVWLDTVTNSENLRWVSISSDLLRTIISLVFVGGGKKALKYTKVIREHVVSHRDISNV